MVFRPDLDDHLCFVLMPLKSPFLEYYEKIIKPAAKKAGLDCLQSKEIYGTGAIIQDIWKHIWRAKVVVAEVTGKNPNVNYELGICHALNIPTILLAQDMGDVPFDYRHRRCIVYDTTVVGWDSILREDIQKTIEKVLESADSESELKWPYNTFDLKELRAASTLITHEKARTVVVQGAALVRDAIASAYGPDGSSLELSIVPGQPNSYKDGSAITRGIRSSNPLEVRGIDAMRQVAIEIRDSMGDSTKTGVILAHSMLKFGGEAVDRGLSAKDVTRSMERAIESALGYLIGAAKTPNTADLRNVARTAAGGDDYVASLVVEAIKRVGRDGVVTLERAVGSKSSLSTVEGMRFDRGYLSEHFINSAERQECVLENSYILTFERKIVSMKSLLPILEEVARTGSPLLVIAEDVEGEALSTLVVNKLRGTLSCCAVRSPGFAERRKATLEDIAVVTGAKAFTDDLGIPLESVRLSDLGSARKIIVSKEETAIVDGAGSQAAIDGRAAAIRRQIQEVSSDIDREKLQERLANLVGGIAILRAGGTTQSDSEQEMYKLQTALFATRSTIEEGFVLGGGQTLFHASRALGKLAGEDDASNAGVRAVAMALQEPLRVLIETGKRSVTQLIPALECTEDMNLGFEAISGDLADLTKEGVLDSAKALRVSLGIAFSHARSILETGAWDLSEPPGEQKKN